MEGHLWEALFLALLHCTIVIAQKASLERIAKRMHADSVIPTPCVNTDAVFVKKDTWAVVKCALKRVCANRTTLV